MYTKGADHLSVLKAQLFPRSWAFFLCKNKKTLIHGESELLSCISGPGVKPFE